MAVQRQLIGKFCFISKFNKPYIAKRPSVSKTKHSVIVYNRKQNDYRTLTPEGHIDIEGCSREENKEGEGYAAGIMHNTLVKYVNLPLN